MVYRVSIHAGPGTTGQAAQKHFQKGQKGQKALGGPRRANGARPDSKVLSPGVASFAPEFWRNLCDKIPTAAEPVTGQPLAGIAEMTGIAPGAHPHIDAEGGSGNCAKCGKSSNVAPRLATHAVLAHGPG